MISNSNVSNPIERQELLATLNTLLEAERAGVRVARETRQELHSGLMVSLVKDIEEDELKWCRMLMRIIRTFGETPSGLTGTFWNKAMAIPDIHQRMIFLNRGQAWVVKQLNALIPRVHQAEIRADLIEMLEVHERNITRVDSITCT